MSSKKNIYAEVDEQGRMIIPKKVLDRYGIKEESGYCYQQKTRK